MSDEQEKFNAYCAKVLGWRRGTTGKFINEYYMLEIGALYGSFMGMVDEYNPYNDLSKMQPVIDSLISGLGLHLDSGEVQQHGLLITCRNLILKHMIDDDNKEVIKGCVGKERFWEDSEDALDVEEGWDEYDRKRREAVVHSNNMMWNNLKFRDMTEDNTTIPEAINNLAETIESLTDEWETKGPIDDELYKLGKQVSDSMQKPHPMYEPVPNCTNFDYDADNGYPNVKEEQAKFNAQCRKIMFKHASLQDNGSLMSAQNFDPYYNGSQLLNVMNIVLLYLPHDITFEVGGESDNSMPGVDMTVQIRNFIRHYGTDEYMLPPAVAFNKQCAILVEGYNIFDCQPVTSDFDPYNNIEDLLPILPIVVRRVQEDFTLGKIMYDLPLEDSYNMDLFDNMRHYVSRHMQALLDILENSE